MFLIIRCAAEGCGHEVAPSVVPIASIIEHQESHTQDQFPYAEGVVITWHVLGHVVGSV